jgi:hypothetical protein
VIKESELDQRALLGPGPQAPPDLFAAPAAVGHARLIWGRRLFWIGRGCLIVFAAAALISTNREAGVLTVGALAKISSPVRGGVQVGVVFLLLPVAAVEMRKFALLQMQSAPQ